jgi:glycosyltransferase involved in cell wall biosynthesis
MRVVHVITRLIIGGAQENTIASVQGLAQIPGVNIQLLSGPTTGPEGSLESEFLATPERLVVFPDLVRPVHPWKDLSALLRLTRWLRHAAPDIVHTHSGKAGVVGRLAARRAGVNCVVHTIHGPSFGNFQGPSANFIFRNAERLAGRLTTHFIAVAQAMAEQYLAAGIGQPGQYTRIFSGFPLAPFLSATNDLALRQQLGLREKDVVIGKIARLFKLKGHEDLLAIAPDLIKKHPAIKLLLVGDGAWRARFEQMTADLGLKNQVVFAGLVPPAEVPRYLGLMDILVHLSRREGLPRALPQAMAAGRPIVAYDCDGAREVCLDHQTGFLVAPGDQSGLQDRLLRLAKDPALRQQLGTSGRALARTEFSVDKMVESIYKVYKKLLLPPRPDQTPVRP